MTMRDMTLAEMAVVTAMNNGDLKPLAALLGDESPDVHPIIQRNLRRLLTGSADETDFRLAAQQHPDLKDMRNGVRASSAKTIRDIELAERMATNGAFKHKCWEAALNDTMTQTGFGKTIVTNAWRRQKGFVRFCILRGAMDLRADYRPD